jgi:hypothetical protein
VGEPRVPPRPNNCPIFDYTAGGLRRLFGGAGFDRIELREGNSGFLLRAS